MRRRAVHSKSHRLAALHKSSENAEIGILADWIEENQLEPLSIVIIRVCIGYVRLYNKDSSTIEWTEKKKQKQWPRRRFASLEHFLYNSSAQLFCCFFSFGWRSLNKGTVANENVEWIVWKQVTYHFMANKCEFRNVGNPNYYLILIGSDFSGVSNYTEKQKHMPDATVATTANW